jgi:hypothetical protein
MVWELKVKEQNLFLWNNRNSEQQKSGILTGLETESWNVPIDKVGADKIYYNFVNMYLNWFHF